MEEIPGRKWSKSGTISLVFRGSIKTSQVHFFDTAEVYGFGKSERLLGACLRQDARPTVIASKYMPLPLHPFEKALDGSLKRLGVQTINLYSIHFPRGNIEQLMDQMALAFADGKIRAIGVSNFSAVQMRQAAARLARYDIPLAANEVHYNLLHRQPEVDGVLDACRELNVALVAYVPLASGRLASTSSSSTRGSVALQTLLTTIAHTRSKSVPQVALNWLVRRDRHYHSHSGSHQRSSRAGECRGAYLGAER